MSILPPRKELEEVLHGACLDIDIKVNGKLVLGKAIRTSEDIVTPTSFLPIIIRGMLQELINFDSERMRLHILDVLKEPKGG